MNYHVGDAQLRLILQVKNLKVEAADSKHYYEHQLSDKLSLKRNPNRRLAEGWEDSVSELNPPTNLWKFWEVVLTVKILPMTELQSAESYDTLWNHVIKCIMHLDFPTGLFPLTHFSYSNITIPWSASGSCPHTNLLMYRFVSPFF